MNNNAYTTKNLTTFDNVLGVTQFGLYLTLKVGYIVVRTFFFLALSTFYCRVYAYLVARYRGNTDKSKFF